MDFIRLLEAHPEWRAELRRLVLSEELLRLPELVQQLVEAQRRAEEQRAEARLERVEKRLERVEKRLEHVEIRLEGVEKRLEKAEDRLSKVWGGFLEGRYRDRAHAYFGPVLSRIRVLSGEQLVQLLDEALEAGRLSEADRRDLLLADLVFQGRRETQEVYLVAEISGLISEDDVR
jgi:tetrahydromethanopterin S-methyltransferase subunit G